MKKSINQSKNILNVLNVLALLLLGSDFLFSQVSNTINLEAEVLIKFDEADKNRIRNFTIDENGSLYVLNRNKKQIIHYSKDGAEIGGIGEAGFLKWGKEGGIGPPRNM